MHYWDTSALVKLYVDEPESALFAAHQASTGQLASSAPARREVYRGLHRKEADGSTP